MTLEDMHTAFDVELDKLNGTSYPSFLPEEKDFWLNKAYLMLINQKFTGSNVLGEGFEGGVKRIADLQNLLRTARLTDTSENTTNNLINYEIILSDKMLYFISAIFVQMKDDNQTVDTTIPIRLVTHDVLQNFMATPHNLPYIPYPVGVIDQDQFIIAVDRFEYSKEKTDKCQVEINYIKYPKTFDSSKTNGNSTITGLQDSPEIAEHTHNEIVALAVYLAIENIESPRVQTNVQPLNMQE